MTDNPTLKDRFEAEQRAIDALTDSTEAALALAELRAKINAAKGERGASQELAKAKRALDDYRRERDNGDSFANAADVARHLAGLGWLGRNGKPVSERTVAHHVATGQLSRGKQGFAVKTVMAYAAANLLSPQSDTTRPPDQFDAKERLTRAMADERELRTKKLRGELIDAAEEEARDARLWGAIVADIHQYAPGIVSELIERVIGRLPAEYHPAIVALVPELREQYEQYLDEMFDRYAREGGMVVMEPEEYAEHAA